MTLKKIASSQAAKPRTRVGPSHAAQGESTTQTIAATDRVPAGVPVVYADQIMDVIYGIHTSKLVFGIESGNGIRPVGVAIVPTAALMLSALTIIENLSSPAIIEETGTRFASILQMMNGNVSNPKE
jgi:hypothetical protein